MLLKKIVVSKVWLKERLACSILIMPTFCMLWIDGVVAWWLIAVRRADVFINSQK